MTQPHDGAACPKDATGAPDARAIRDYMLAIGHRLVASAEVNGSMKSEADIQDLRNLWLLAGCATCGPTLLREIKACAMVVEMVRACCDHASEKAAAAPQVVN